jgi:Protein kinase domain
LKISLPDRPLTNEIEVYTTIPESRYLPKYYGHGKTRNGREFIVIEKFASDFTNWMTYKKDHFIAIISKIISALELMHSYDFIHCDIKSQNVLLGGSIAQVKEAVLTDFGLAFKLGQSPKPKVPRRTTNGALLSSDLSFGYGETDLSYIDRNYDTTILGARVIYWIVQREFSHDEHVALKEAIDAKSTTQLRNFLSTQKISSISINRLVAYFESIWKPENTHLPNYSQLTIFS